MTLHTRSAIAALAASVALIAILIAGASLTAHEARANGVPLEVPLAYIPGLSNWGPEDASGKVEMSFAEGYAHLDAEGMPQLQAERYQGWIVNSESNDAISIGSFNADANNVISYEGTLPAISDFGFDLFIITVEPDPDDAPQPTADRSIGGRFTLLGEIPGDNDTPGDVQTSPTELPNTGDPTLITDIARMGLLLGAIAVSLFIGLRLGRKRA